MMLVTGCMPSLDAFCMTQDDECASFVCGEKVKDWFIYCNDVCGGSLPATPDPSIHCECLQYGVLMCPADDAITKREVQPQSSLQELFLTNRAAVNIISNNYHYCC
jgi:hypothetical protein